MISKKFIEKEIFYFRTIENDEFYVNKNCSAIKTRIFNIDKSSPIEILNPCFICTNFIKQDMNGSNFIDKNINEIGNVKSEKKFNNLKSRQNLFLNSSKS